MKKLKAILRFFTWSGFKDITGFEVKHDLDHLVWDFHNKCHYYGSMVMSIGFGAYWGPVRGFLLSYGIWYLWEIGDGFKPWWHAKEYAHWYQEEGLWAKFKTEALLSDKFSMQDAYHWDLGGASLGFGWIALFTIVTNLLWGSVTSVPEILRLLW